MTKPKTSRTGRILGILLCAFAIYVIGYYHGAGRNVLYTAQFKVVDAESKAPIDAHFTFSDRMDLWPKPSRLEPGSRTGGITVSLPDGSRAVAWLGRRSSTPVRLPLYVDDYSEGFVELQQHGGGFYSIPNLRINVIELDSHVPQKTQAEQGGADQPATAPESTPEDSENPQQESEGRSQ